jgi:hypothetical protein
MARQLRGGLLPQSELEASWFAQVFNPRSALVPVQVTPAPVPGQGGGGSAPFLNNGEHITSTVRIAGENFDPVDATKKRLNITQQVTPAAGATATVGFPVPNGQIYQIETVQFFISPTPDLTQPFTNVYLSLYINSDPVQNNILIYGYTTIPYRTYVLIQALQMFNVLVGYGAPWNGTQQLQVVLNGWTFANNNLPIQLQGIRGQ